MKGEVAHQNALPSFWILLVNSLYKIVNAFEILLFSDLIMVLLDIN